MICAVAHDKLKNITLDQIEDMQNGDIKVLIDVKGLYDRDKAIEKEFIYFRL